MAGAQVCELVWKNDVAYCEFSNPDTSPIQVKASTLLDTLRKMVKNS